MTHLDDQLSDAAADLRAELDRRAVPEFRPKRTPTPLVLALALVLGIGIVGLVARTRSTDTGTIAVATQPDPTAVDEDAGLPRVGRLTAADAGEFYVPLSLEASWSADESKIIVYRTGSALPGHVVIDVVSGEELVVLPFTPADIEQIYWHPQDPDQILYTSGSALMSYAMSSRGSTVVHDFADCDRVDSGRLPVPPSADGTVSLLCALSTGLDQVTYQLGSAQVRRTATQSDSAAFPSPSGAWVLRWNDDGSVSILDRDLRDTSRRLDLDQNLFRFVTTDDGREWAAATLFDGPHVGSLVLLPLDGVTEPIVVIGPDAGDAYPPGGTSISAVGSRVALSISGNDDGSLAGRVTTLDVGMLASTTSRSSVAHEGQGRHDYWSSSFVSLSPSGDYVAYSSDMGSDRVDTFIVRSSG